MRFSKIVQEIKKNLGWFRLGWVRLGYGREKNPEIMTP
jgi:hypothetical protein